MVVFEGGGLTINEAVKETWRKVFTAAVVN
jgi:hypothetical protein